MHLLGRSRGGIAILVASDAQGARVGFTLEACARRVGELIALGQNHPSPSDSPALPTLSYLTTLFVLSRPSCFSFGKRNGRRHRKGERNRGATRKGETVAASSDRRRSKQPSRQRSSRSRGTTCVLSNFRTTTPGVPSPGITLSTTVRLYSCRILRNELLNRRTLACRILMPHLAIFNPTVFDTSRASFQLNTIVLALPCRLYRCLPSALRAHPCPFIYIHYRIISNLLQ